jgi:hypothetical protein
LKQCEWCNASFDPSVSYQIYCTVTCREEATKEKIADRHKAMRRQRKGNKVRHCAAGCGTRLSMYNDDAFCASCFLDNREIRRGIREIKMMMHDYEDKTE